MFLYPPVCEPIAYTAYIFFCDCERKWIDGFKVAYMAISLVGLRSHQFLWTVRGVEIDPLHLIPGK